MSLGEGYGKDDYGILKGAPPPLALVRHPDPIACLAELSKLWGRSKGRNVCEAPLANLKRKWQQHSGSGLHHMDVMVPIV